MKLRDKRLLCFIGFFTINIASNGAILHFVNEPQSVTVKAGAGIELVCLTEPRDGTDVRWRLNGSPFTSDLTRGIMVRVGQLQITNVTTSLAGSYDCVANNSRGAVISQPADVRIAEQWGFQPGLKDVLTNVTEGNVALIPCSPPQGIPLPTVSFEFNGKTLDSSTGRHFVLPSGNLQIQGARISDQGTYRCVATNPVSGQRVLADNTVQLRVTTPLTRVATRLVHQPPEKVEVVIGQLLALECVVEGSPVPVVTWYKHGGQLPEGRFEKNLGNLFIHNVDTFDHGNYICRADNGSPPHQAAVVVVDVLEKPSVRMAVGVQRVPEGTKTQLECHAHGKPRVYVKWLHNGEDVGLDPSIISTDQMLTIGVTQPHHAGYYQCVASNRLGVTYATAYVEVTDKNSRPAPLPVQPPQPKTPAGGSTSQQKDKQGRSRTNTPVPERPEDQSTMSDMSAVDDIVHVDEDYEDMDVDIPGPVDESQKPKKKSNDDSNKVMTPPSRPIVTQSGDSAVVVKWIVPENNGLPIIFFRIQYKDVRGTGRWQTLEHDILAAVREYEVTGLEPGATYKFRVMAVYSNHDNRPSETSARITLATSGDSVNIAPPDSYPLIVEVKALSVDSLAIRWQYMPSGLMPVEGFYVYYKLYSFPGNYQRETIIGSNLRYHILRGLQPGAEYSLRMQCFNMAGTGDYSNTVVRRTSASHEVNDDGTVVVDEFHPEDRWSSSRNNIIPPALATPPSSSNDKVPVEGQKGNDTLYLVLGVVLGVMVIVLLIFVVMCGTRQVHQRKRMAAMVNGKFYETAPMMQHNTMLAKQNPQFQMNGPSQAGNGHSTLNNGWLTSGSLMTDGQLNINVNPMSDIDNGTLRTEDSKAYQTIQSVIDQPLTNGIYSSTSSAPPPLPQPRTRPGQTFPAYGSSSSAQSNVSYNVLDPTYIADNGASAYQLQQQSVPFQGPYTGAFSSFHPRARDAAGNCIGQHHHDHAGNDEHIYSGSTCGDGCEPLADGDCTCPECQECPDCYQATRHHHAGSAHYHGGHSPPTHMLSEHASTSSSRSSASGHNAAAIVLQNIDNATRERGATLPDGYFLPLGGVRYPSAHSFNGAMLPGQGLVAPYKSAQSQHRPQYHSSGAVGHRRHDMTSVNDYSASDVDDEEM